jgi:hypothetical protein
MSYRYQYWRLTCRQCGKSRVVNKLENLNECYYCHSDRVVVHEYEPNGTIFVWDEQELFSTEVYQFARFNIIDMAELKRKAALMAEEDAKIFTALRPEGTIYVYDEQPHGT